MEEKKTIELTDETLDEVTGGGGFTKPGDETYEQELMGGQEKCGYCGGVITPKWNQATPKYFCPNCQNDL